MEFLSRKKMARDDRVTFYQGMAQETNVADRRHVSARGHVSALQCPLTNLGYLQLHMQHQKNKLMQSHGRVKNVADHWCEKGHILLCLEGEFHTELKDGRTVRIGRGMTYEVADGAQPQRSLSPRGAKLFIVD
jgi:hypothetical protein